jgi:hypothetical protein
MIGQRSSRFAEILEADAEEGRATGAEGLDDRLGSDPWFSEDWNPHSEQLRATLVYHGDSKRGRETTSGCTNE